MRDVYDRPVFAYAASDRKLPDERLSESRLLPDLFMQRETVGGGPD
jgi:hypothetical protein